MSEPTTPAPTARKILLRGGHLITVDDALGDFRGDLLIENGRIAALAPRLDIEDAAIVDASRHIVMPGFVDSHRHTWQTPLRHTGSDWDLPKMFVELFVKFGPRFRPDDVYASAQYGRLAALDGGVTTLLDWSHIQNSPAHADAAIDGLSATGGRSIFAHGQPGNDPKPWMVESVLHHPQDIVRVRRERLSSDDGLVTMAMAARGPEFCTMDAVAHDIGLARELGLRVTMHLGLSTNGPKYRGIARMHERGLLGPDITCVHCCTCSDHEFHLLAQAGATVAISAQINMIAGGFGVPPTGRLLAQGLRPSLSVDSEMSASGDMFFEMRAAFQMERAVILNAFQPRADGAWLTAREVIAFATLEGARAVGLDNRIGSLTPGKAADIILIRADAPNLAPIRDPAGALVLGGHAGNVESVFVAGRAVKWNGRMLSCDLSRALAELERSCAYLYQPSR